MKSVSRDSQIVKGLASLHFKYFLRHNPELGTNKFEMPKPIKKISKSEKENSLNLSYRESINVDKENVSNMMGFLKNYLQNLETDC